MTSYGLRRHGRPGHQRLHGTRTMLRVGIVTFRCKEEPFHVGATQPEHGGSVRHAEHCAAVSGEH